MCHFERDCRKHLLRHRSVGDKRRNPAQRCLFVGKPAKILSRLGCRDRGGHQLGEPR
jgi:hypothetical protein